MKAEERANNFSIKEQVKAAKNEISKTIAILIEVNETKAIAAAKAVKEKLASSSGIISREDIGEIQVGEKIKEGIAYVHTKAEIAAISIVPQIIEQGVIITKTPIIKEGATQQ